MSQHDKDGTALGTSLTTRFLQRLDEHGQFDARIVEEPPRRITIRRFHVLTNQAFITSLKPPILDWQKNPIQPTLDN